MSCETDRVGQVGELPLWLCERTEDYDRANVPCADGGGWVAISSHSTVPEKILHWKGVPYHA
jgi:hypothetical protein